MDEGRSLFDILPTDYIFNVAKHLNAHNLLTICFTSDQWEYICDYPDGNFWRDPFNEKFQGLPLPEKPIRDSYFKYKLMDKGLDNFMNIGLNMIENLNGNDSYNVIDARLSHNPRGRNPNQTYDSNYLKKMSVQREQLEKILEKSKDDFVLYSYPLQSGEKYWI